jgi:hypothetical protein
VQKFPDTVPSEGLTVPRQKVQSVNRFWIFPKRRFEKLLPIEMSRSAGLSRRLHFMIYSSRTP